MSIREEKEIKGIQIGKEEVKQISGRIYYLQLKLFGVRRRVYQTKLLVWKPLELMTYSGVLAST